MQFEKLLKKSDIKIELIYLRNFLLTEFFECCKFFCKEISLKLVKIKKQSMNRH